MTGRSAAARSGSQHGSQRTDRVRTDHVRPEGELLRPETGFKGTVLLLHTTDICCHRRARAAAVPAVPGGETEQEKCSGSVIILFR